MNFAKDNDLTVNEACEIPISHGAHPSNPANRKP
jgi:hypothetical protein